MGGFGKYYSSKETYKVRIYDQINPLPMMFITGSNDDYLSSVNMCYQYFNPKTMIAF